METIYAFLLYQNQLFADGLASILRQNNFIVIKGMINKVDYKSLSFFEKTNLLIIEAGWPFLSVGNVIGELNKLLDKRSFTLLIPNLVCQDVIRFSNDGLVDGIVLKSSNSEEFLFAINQVLRGSNYYSSALADTLFKDNKKLNQIHISKREKQILSLLAETKTTQEIAHKLSITTSTVKTHRRNLMQKFNAKSLLCLLRMACRENFLNEENDFCKCCYKQFIGT